MGWLPGCLLRWRFSKEELSSRVRIDVRARPWALQLDGTDQSATIIIEIQNNGYFRIELDRVTAILNIGKPVGFLRSGSCSVRA